MSLQICPHCCQRGFTWHIDEDVGPLTQWHCGLCGYQAQEDESLAMTCPACGHPEARIRLSEKRGEFWFCLKCQGSEPAFGTSA